jgi:hypothetical protein
MIETKSLFLFILFASILINMITYDENFVKERKFLFLKLGPGFTTKPLFWILFTISYLSLITLILLED